jgi:hypothetical protein
MPDLLTDDPRPPDGVYPPSVRCKESTQVLMDLFLGSVRKLLAAEFDARGLVVLAHPHVAAVDNDEFNATLAFAVRFRGPDDTEIILARAAVTPEAPR